jgi:hypothetical protein
MTRNLVERLKKRFFRDLYTYYLCAKHKIIPFPKLTIITAADKTYFQPLKRLITSLSRYEKDDDSDIIIYDLGLSQDQVESINSEYPKITIKKKDFKKAIPWCDIRTNAGFYAWKPFLVYETLLETKNDILWLDSSVIVNRKLWRIRARLLKQGFYASRWPGFNIKDRTANSTIEILEAGNEANLPMTVAAVVGFSARNALSNKLLHEWATLSADPNVNNPPFVTTANHKGDQSILSILVHRYGLYNYALRSDDCDWLDFFIDNNRVNMFRVKQ